MLTRRGPSPRNEEGKQKEGKNVRGRSKEWGRARNEERTGEGIGLLGGKEEKQKEKNMGRMEDVKEENVGAR